MSDEKTILKMQSSAVNCLRQISDVLRQRVVRITGDESEEEARSKSDWGIDNDKWGWGQYLDCTRNVGVYGTSVGLQSLLICGELISGETTESEIIQKSLNWLISQYENPDSRANKKDDFKLILKVSHLVNALSVTGYDITSSTMERAFRFLIDAQLDEGGWGFYYFTPKEKDDEYRVICTCNALLALRHSKDFRASSRFIEGVAWLLDQISKESAGASALIITSLIELGIHRNLHAILQGVGALPEIIDDENAWSLIHMDASVQDRTRFFQLSSRGCILKALALLDIDLFFSNKTLSQRFSGIVKNIEKNGSYKDGDHISMRDVLEISGFLSTFVKIIDEKRDHILLHQRLDSIEAEYAEIHQLIRSKSFKLVRFIFKCLDKIFAWFKRFYAIPISVVLLLTLWLGWKLTQSKGFVWALLVALIPGIVINLTTRLRKRKK